MFKTPKGVILFHHLDKVDTQGEYASNEYGLTLLLPKELPAVQAMLDQCKSWYAQTTRGKPMTIRDGDESEYSSSHGHWLFRSHTKHAPRIVDRFDADIDPALPKRGDEGLALISPAFFGRRADGAKAEGVTFYLVGFQLVRQNSLGASFGAYEEDGEASTEPTEETTAHIEELPATSSPQEKLEFIKRRRVQRAA